MEGVYDENERQPEGVDGVSWRICERGVYSVFMDTSDEKKNTQKERERKGGMERTKKTPIYFAGEWRRTPGERGRTDKQTML